MVEQSLAVDAALHKIDECVDEVGMSISWLTRTITQLADHTERVVRSGTSDDDREEAYRLVRSALSFSADEVEDLALLVDPEQSAVHAGFSRMRDQVVTDDDPYFSTREVWEFRSTVPCWLQSDSQLEISVLWTALGSFPGTWSVTITTPFGLVSASSRMLRHALDQASSNNLEDITGPLERVIIQDASAYLRSAAVAEQSDPEFVVPA